MREFCTSGSVGTSGRKRPGVTRQISPQEVSRAASDWTPGSKPTTLMRAIKKLAKNPSQYELSLDKDLSAASPQNPIVTLLDWGRGSFHYVSVVGVKGDRVVFNHWGTQENMPKAEFDRRWAFNSPGITDDLVSALGGLTGHTTIRKKPQ
jgi:hypothetical protein